jgi:hypothetical protein
MKAKLCGFAIMLASVAFLSLSTPEQAESGLFSRLFRGNDGYSSCGASSGGYSSCGASYNSGYSSCGASSYGGYSSCGGQQSFDYNYSYAPPVQFIQPAQGSTYCVNGVCYTTSAPMPQVVQYAQAPAKPKIENGLVFTGTTNCPHCETAKEAISESKADVIIAKGSEYLQDWPSKYELAYPAWMKYENGKVVSAWTGRADPEDVRSMAGLPPLSEVSKTEYRDYSLFDEEVSEPLFASR